MGNFYFLCFAVFFKWNFYLFHFLNYTKIESCIDWIEFFLYFASVIFSSRLSVIVVRKKCMPRFFTEINRTVQNPPLGTVVDSEATRNEWQVPLENQVLTKHSLCPVYV